jgi:hypothetical protein
MRTEIFLQNVARSHGSAVARRCATLLHEQQDVDPITRMHTVGVAISGLETPGERKQSLHFAAGVVPFGASLPSDRTSAAGEG